MFIFNTIKSYPEVLLNEVFYSDLHSKIEARLEDSSEIVSLTISIFREIAISVDAPNFVLPFIEDSVVKLISKLLSSIEDTSNPDLCENIADCVSSCFKFMGRHSSCFIKDYFSFIIGMFDNTNKLGVSNSKIQQNADEQNYQIQSISLQGCFCKIIRALIETDNGLLSSEFALLILTCIFESYELNKCIDTPSVDLITKLSILQLPVVLTKVDHLLSLIIQTVINKEQFNRSYAQTCKLISYLCTTINPELLKDFIEKLVLQFTQYLTIEDGEELFEEDQEDIVLSCNIISCVSETISDIILVLNSKANSRVDMDSLKSILSRNLEMFRKFEESPILSQSVKKLSESIESTLELAELMV